MEPCKLRSPDPEILLIKRFPEAEILLEPVILPNISAFSPTISWPFINVVGISYFLYQL